jgi:predicted SnoaL-like aldol condensation-catalyzing enzyme
MTAIEDANKTLVIEAFDTLFNRRDYAGAEAFWSPDYIQHSAHILPGRAGLFDLVKSLPAELRYEHQLVVADGDHVMLHGRFSGHGLPANWVVVDVVRIADGKLAEHWDVIQDEAGRGESQSGLPMFGDTFPPPRPPAPASGLLQSFVDYLRGRPADVDTASTRSFNDGHVALEGIASRASSLGGVPAITLEPLVGSPERTVLYFHGGGYVSGSPPDRYLPPSRSPRTPECTPSTTAWLRNTAFPPPLTTASPLTGQSSETAEPIRRRSLCSGTLLAATWPWPWRSRPVTRTCRCRHALR